jgi:hypothetical protein
LTEPAARFLLKAVCPIKSGVKQFQIIVVPMIWLLPIGFNADVEVDPRDIASLLLE